jgi:hypothetical protein
LPRAGCSGFVFGRGVRHHGRASPLFGRLLRAPFPPIGTCRAGFERVLRPPPLCRRSRRRGGYRDACSIARSSARTIGRVFDTPLRAPQMISWGARPPGAAGRPRAASRAPARRRARPRAPAGCEGKASCSMTPQATTRERRQLCQTHSLVNGCVRQSGGAGSGGKPDKAGAVSCCLASTF